MNYAITKLDRFVSLLPVFLSRVSNCSCVEREAAIAFVRPSVRLSHADIVILRSSTIAEGPRDAPCHMLYRNETRPNVSS